MTSHLNLIGSIIIGGLLFLMINKFHSSLNQNSKEQVLSSITIENSTSITRLIEFDFNRMGLRVSTNTNSVIQADSNQITFLSDIDDNGVVDTLRYFTSDTSLTPSTDNPRDRILYRLVNNEDQTDAAMGVTRFHVRYLDWLGYDTTNVSQIRTFVITLRVESIAPYDDQYPSFYWQTRITPPNLARL